MEIPRHWRLKKQRYALVGEVCPHCVGHTSVFSLESLAQGFFYDHIRTPLERSVNDNLLRFQFDVTFSLSYSYSFRLRRRQSNEVNCLYHQRFCRSKDF